MVEVDLLWLVGLVAGGLAAYAIFRYRLHQIRKLIDALDDAVTDDKVTEEEFRIIYELVREIIYGPRTV